VSNYSPSVLTPQFLACMPFIYREEGGYSNDPHDSGGATDHGIIQSEYNAWRKLHSEAQQSVKLINYPDESNQIYWTQYWLPYCPLLPSGPNLCLFNFGINAGVSEAVKILQRAVNVTVDGHFGLETEAACNAADPKKLIYAFTLKEESFYRSLPTFKYFGSDWIGRSERCESLSISMLAPTPIVTLAPPTPSDTSTVLQTSEVGP
jgi:lysozyme family protein